MPVVDEPHRPARDPRELGGRERLEACALLGAEAAADELRPHADVVLAQAEGRGELVAGGEHPLGRHPGGEPVAVPGGDGRMRLERRLQLRRCLDGELDRHLGSGERRLGVAAGIVRRIGGEALLVEGLLRVDDVSEHLEVEGERRDPGARRLERVGRDDRDRLARVGGLGGEQRGARRQRELALRADHRPDTGTARAASRSSERTRPCAARRTKHRRVEHARRGARRP